MSDTAIILRYTGGGYGGWLPGVPARDLTTADADQFGGAAPLLATGVYDWVGPGDPPVPTVQRAADERDDSTTDKPRPDQDKQLPGPTENKAGDA